MMSYIGERKSLIRKALVMVGAAAMLASVLFIVVTQFIMRNQIEQRYLEHLHELAESMSRMASFACYTRDAAQAMETVEAFTKYSSIIRRVSIRANGELLAEGGHGKASDIRTDSITLPLYSPFDTNDKVGEITLEPDWEVIDDKIIDIARNVGILFFLLSAGIVCVIALVISIVIVRPVKAISDNLHALDARSSDMLDIPAGHKENELGRLVGDMNDLLFRLRNFLSQEHELHLHRVLNERLRLYATIFEHSQEGILITDSDNHIVAVNRAFTRITGYTESEVLGRNPNIKSSGRHDRTFYEKMWNELIVTSHWKGELWNRAKDGRIKPELSSISVVHDDQGDISNYIAIFSDISDRKQDAERIEFLAHHDPLTGLPNRLLTRDRFSQAVEAAAREKTSVAMLCIDLDGFKHVNDTLGHPVGDQLLQSAAERLKSQVREADTISRQGGDEFMILLAGIKDYEVTRRITKGILDKLSLPFDIAGHTIGISASIGVAYYPQHGEDFDTVMKNADAAMYSAKKSGKNAARVFREEMSVDVLDKLVLRARLSYALQNREFHIVFQPQVNTLTNRIIGAEVLCRWVNPELGIIPPNRFIALAEESGLINPLGEWILEQACLQGKRWFDDGIPPFVIAVNVSSQQFNHSDLVETVQKALKKTAFPAQYLELEFTESGLLENVEHSLNSIEKLRELGVTLSIDDFGTGYSSLVYLKQFKVKKLKIDQSFIRDIDDSDDLGIVRAIIQMGQTLQLDVIAEGVETERQKNTLKSLGCHEIQGYLVSRPLLHDGFEKFIRHWNDNIGRVL